MTKWKGLLSEHKPLHGRNNISTNETNQAERLNVNNDAATVNR
jgi:hypothetical protein